MLWKIYIPIKLFKSIVGQSIISDINSSNSIENIKQSKKQGKNMCKKKKKGSMTKNKRKKIIRQTLV